MSKVMEAILGQFKHIVIELESNGVFEVTPDKMNSEHSYFKYLGQYKDKHLEKFLSKVKFPDE